MTTNTDNTSQEVVDVTRFAMVSRTAIISPNRATFR